MKIDKNMIDKVLALNDEQLWKAIQLVASKSGLNTIGKLEQPKDMAKFRAALSGINDEDISRISELIKKGKNNG